MRFSFIVLVTSFLIGVFVRSVYAIGIAEAGLLVSVALAVSAVALARHEHRAFYVVLALVLCALGIMRTEYAYRAYEAVRVYEDGSDFAGEGEIGTEPDIRDGYVVYWVDVPTDRGVTIRVRIKAPPYPRYAYGDQVRVAGTLHVPTAFETDTGRTFDYAGFLMKDHVHYELRRATLEHVSSGGGNPVIAALLTVKHAWLSAVSRLIPEPESALAGGVIVGAKNSLGEQWLAMFRETGLIHIVVLSGYNLTLVANMIVKASAKLPRLAGLGLGALGVVGFALMTGGGATVIRASTMAIFGMLAVYVARPYAVLRSLALAGLLMVLWNPFVLLFDPGFQLSFMATIGLVLGSPIVARFIPWVTARFGLRDIVAATLATQCAVFPLLLYQIGQVSIVAPVVNILVLPFVASMMLWGFLAGLFGMASSVLAAPFAWIAHLLLGYTFVVVEGFARLPFASHTLPPVGPWVVAVLYGALALAYVWLQNTTHAVGGASVSESSRTS